MQQAAATKPRVNHVFMPWWAEPQKHYGSCLVCVCITRSVLPISRLALKTKRWKLLCKHINMGILLPLIWLDFKFKRVYSRVIGMKRPLTLTTVASNKQLSEASCPQQTTFQHDSSIYTTNQMATWVKSKEQNCQSVLKPVCHSLYIVS